MKKCLFAVLGLMFILSLLGCGTKKADSDLPIFEDTEYSTSEDEVSEEVFDEVYFYYSQTAGEDRSIYDAVLQGMLNHDPAISLPADVGEKLEEITQMVLCDHPEIFWVDGAYQYTSYGAKAELNVNYTFDKEECTRRAAEIEKAVGNFNKLLSADDTEYDIIQKAYLYVIDAVKYDANSKDNQTVYSSLVNHKSVCAGYSKAMQYLLQSNGIQALYVSGTANGSSGWDNHAWNIVRCNGQYYQVDSTFGDGYTNPDERMAELRIHNYAYLCIDDKAMYKNHKPTGDMMIPNCVSTELNYYVLNNLYSDEYDDRVITSMRESVYSGQNVWCYQFSNYDSYALCLDDIQNGEYGSLVSEYLNESCQIMYIYDDEMYYILCWY